MKKAIGIKKISALFLASLIAGNILLCSCDKSGETTTEPTEEMTTTTSESTEATTTAPRWESSAPLENPKDTSPYEKITLDGSADSTFVSKDFCYIESDKYVLLLDRDIKLPGDFVTNVDAIVNEIEKQLGVSACPDDRYYGKLVDNSAAYDLKDESGNPINPWEGWDLGTKIPIFLEVDRVDEARISCADSMFTVICDYAMFSDELWDSVPSYKNNSWRRNNYVDYVTIAHELTHTISLRNCEQTRIITEGLAQYISKRVVESLANDYPSIMAAKNGANWEEGDIPKTVNEKTAEKIFIDDYHSLSSKDRGAEYYYGLHFWQYLYENYGDDCFVKFCNNVKINKIQTGLSTYDESIVKEYADVFKKLYGDDFFQKFGKWCVKNNYLQNKNY